MFGRFGQAFGLAFGQTFGRVFGRGFIFDGRAFGFCAAIIAGMVAEFCGAALVPVRQKDFTYDIEIFGNGGGGGVPRGVL